MEETIDLSSGIDEVSSVDDYHLSGSEDSEQETGTSISRRLRSASVPKKNAVLSKKNDDKVQEPMNGHKSILEPQNKNKDEDISETELFDDFEMAEDIFGNKFSVRKELSLFLHTYI